MASLIGEGEGCKGFKGKVFDDKLYIGVGAGAGLGLYSMYSSGWSPDELVPSLIVAAVGGVGIYVGLSLLKCSVCNGASSGMDYMMCFTSGLAEDAGNAYLNSALGVVDFFDPDTGAALRKELTDAGNGNMMRGAAVIAKRDLSNAASAIKNGIEIEASVAEKQAKELGGHVTDAANTVGDGVKSAANKVGDGVTSAADTVGDGVKDAFGTVSGWF